MRVVPNELGLRTWLFILSLLAVFPLLLFAGLGISQFEQDQRHAILVDLDHRAQHLAEKVETHVNNAIAILETLAAADAAQRDDLRTLHETSRRVVQGNPAFRAIGLVDANDRVLFVTTLPFGGDTLALNQGQMVHEAFRTAKPNVSGIFTSRQTRDKVVAVSVPVLRNGKVAYVLRMILAADSIGNLLAEYALPQGWLSAIVDREGILLARNVDAPKFLGMRATAPFLKAMQTRERRLFDSVNLLGVPIKNMMVPIHGGDWFLGVAVPTSVLDGPVRDRIRDFAGYGLAWILLSLALSQLMAYFLSRQVAILTRAVADRSVSDPALLKVRVTEFGRLLKGYLEARRAEKAVRGDLFQVAGERDEVRDLYDHAPCGYHSLDRDGRVIHINQTELGWMGLTSDEVLGRPYSDFLNESGKEVFRNGFPLLVRSGKINDVEYELLRKDGTTMPVLLSATAIKDAAGEFVSSRSTVFDLTERKRFEAQLVAANAELTQHKEHLEDLVQERTRKLAESLEASQGADRAKTALLANVSHELRTPLNHIVGNAYLLERQIEQPAQKDKIETITSSSRRLLSMVNDLIDVAQLEGRELRLEPATFKLTELIEGVRGKAVAAMRAKGLELVVEVDASLPAALVGDSARLIQVLRHLLDNAEKYSDRGQVSLRVRSAGQRGPQVTIRVEVQDQGRGLSKELRRTLFTLFHQGDGSSTREHGGTGLGLALCQRLIKLMGGEIGVDGVPGGGSCFWFTVTLPEGQAPEPSAPVASEPVNWPDAMEAATRVERLLAEDDAACMDVWQDNTRLLSGLLEDQTEAFAQALERYEFSEALEILRRQMQRPVVQ
ncbi:MAG: ATP-binding protein [Pseudomonadota bacterium]